MSQMPRIRDALAGLPPGKYLLVEMASQNGATASVTISRTAFPGKFRIWIDQTFPSGRHRAGGRVGSASSILRQLDGGMPVIKIAYFKGYHPAMDKQQQVLFSAPAPPRPPPPPPRGLLARFRSVISRRSQRRRS